jgi:aspartate aminotransferase
MASQTITRNVATQSWFDQARFIQPDAIFALTAQYLADTSPKKVNLGQGTYRDEHGNPWVLPSVRKSRKLLSELDHEYLPILGLADFRKEAAKLALGPDLFQKQQDKVLTLPYFVTSLLSRKKLTIV